MTDAPKIAEKLVELDKRLDPDLQNRYAEGITALYASRLTAPRRAGYFALCLAGLVGGLAIGSLAITEPAAVPWTTRLALAACSLFGLSWSVLAAWTLVGRRSFELHQRIAARMALGFTLASVLLTGLLVAAKGGETGTAMLSVNLALLIVAAVVFLGRAIDSAEKRTAEKLLRLELRLAELKE